MSDKKEFNRQSYECPVHGIISGDEVREEEIDYGELRHWCLECKSEVRYVGKRETPQSKPLMGKQK